MKRLEDIFAGYVELTASERAFILSALMEQYLRGGWFPPCENKREFFRQVSAKVDNLKFHRMVTPDGTRLVTVEEHDAIVAELYPEKP